MNLFIESDMQFEKVAGEVELPEDPNQWPQEILDELHKQVPFIADFQPHVVMDKVDAERAYGFGNVEIANKSEAQSGTDPAMMQAAGIRTVRIPIVIREGKLFTFDLLINDAAKALPLTESRMRQALFRPQAFDVTSMTPGDQSMIGQLYPPYRQNMGFGGGGGMTVPADGMGKQSSVLEEFLIEELEKNDAGFRKVKEKTAGAPFPPEFFKTGSILEAILPTINESDLNNFWETTKDRDLQLAFMKNAHANMDAISLLASDRLAKTASVRDFVRPDVVQILSEDDGYIVKSASSKYWDVKMEKLGRAELIRRFGEKIALAADTAGAVTMSDEEGMPGGEGMAHVETPSTATNISHSGMYKVKDDKGREIIGYVIPNLIDMDGLPVPLALFTNGSQTTVQSDIIGEPVASGANLPTSEPGGVGAFFEIASDGTIRATLPMTLQGSAGMAGEPGTFSGETYDGRPALVSLQPNIQEPVAMEEEGKLLLPQHWKWTPMDKADQVVLEGGEDAEGPPEEDMQAPQPQEGPTPGAGAPAEGVEAPPAKTASAFVNLCSEGGTFYFRGEPVEKLASVDKTFLDVDQTMFLLAGLGVDLQHGVMKMAQAIESSPVKVHVGRLIKTAKEQKAEAYERAKEAMARFPNLRKNLVKEAAQMTDPTAVDTVLSLGFINPENLMTFVGYLPTLDSTQSKMCELLLAARLGMQDVPVSALERAVRATEEVIEGLRIIAFQGA
jgi:hypothetical protein